MEKDIVSVIMPIYNAQKYLRMSLESVINQTYLDLDIVLINDGSTDKSREICEEYARQDKRIRIIDKENGGNGDARNVGLRNANGDWIIWIDSDDIMHLRQVEILTSIAKLNNADIVVGDYRTIEDNECVQDDMISSQYTEKAYVLTEKDLYDDSFVNRNSMIFTVPWCKIVRKEIFNGIAYPTKTRHVDTWTTWKTYEKAQKVMFIPLQLYYWRINPNSLSRDKFDSSQFTGIDAYIEQFQYFNEKGKQRYIEIVFSELLEMFFWCYNRMSELEMDYSELKIYLKFLQKNIRNIKYTRSLGLYKWIKYRYLVWYKIPKLFKQDSR